MSYLSDSDSCWTALPYFFSSYQSKEPWKYMGQRLPITSQWNPSALPVWTAWSLLPPVPLSTWSCFASPPAVGSSHMASFHFLRKALTQVCPRPTQVLRAPLTCFQVSKVRYLIYPLSPHLPLIIHHQVSLFPPQYSLQVINMHFPASPWDCKVPRCRDRVT